MKRIGLFRIALAAVATALPGGAATVTWTGGAPVSNNLWGTVSPTHNNWTAGAGNVAWTQGSDALFNGEPPQVGGFDVRVTGGAMQFNSLTVQNITDGAMSISKISGNDADRLTAVGIATVNVPTGTSLTLPLVDGSVGLILAGGGTLLSSRGLSYTGGTTILGGTIQTGSSILAASTGTLTLLATSGAADARFFVRGVNNSWTFANNIVVPSGSSGTATIENQPTTGSGFTPVISGTLSLDRGLTVKLTGTQTVSMTLSGNVSGAGVLRLEGNSSTAQTFILSGDNSAHTGAIQLTVNSSNKNLQLDGTQGNANLTVGSNVDILGSGTLIYNIANDTADLITLGAGSTLNLTGMALQPSLSGVQSLSEYVLVNTTSGVTGPFASILDSAFYTFAVDYDGTTLNPGKVVLLYTLVPEPASFLLLVAGCLALRRRK